MAKKYKLAIPEDILRWVHPELKERQGEVGNLWDDALHDLGWLVEEKLMTRAEWFKEKAEKIGLHEGNSDYENAKVWSEMGWSACEKNEALKYKPLVDLVDKLAGHEIEIIFHGETFSFLDIMGEYEKINQSN